MGCCGKNRITHSELAAAKIPPMQTAPSNVGPHASRAQAVAGNQPATGSVSVRYLEHPSIVVRGPATGRQYAFSGTNPVQSVDARDASAFMHTRFFRRA
jgi:hypothetical protein